MTDGMKIGVLVIIGMTVFFTLLIMASDMAGLRTAQLMQICVEAGGSYDKSRGDCILPDVPLED